MSQCLHKVKHYAMERIFKYHVGISWIEINMKNLGKHVIIPLATNNLSYVRDDFLLAPLIMVSSLRH